MMVKLAYGDALTGCGIYSVSEASRLTGVSSPRVRRWLKGYEYQHKGMVRHSTAVWSGELPVVDGQVALSFRDLIEVRFIDAFRQHGVSWRVIRLAATRAQELLGTSHPFSAKGFRTDGKAIFADIATEDGNDALLDLAKSQFAIREILNDHLYEGLEFDSTGEVAQRWWPLGYKKSVVLDPARSFGQPIVDDAGVPTSILSNAFDVEQDYKRVAKWYDVAVKAVRDAVAFETKHS